MKKIILVLVIVIMFVLQPVVWLGVTWVHEEVHRWDYREVGKVNESICIWEECDGKSVGHYSFTPTNKVENEKAVVVSRYTERNAYGVSIMMGLRYVLGCLLILKKMKGGD